MFAAERTNLFDVLLVAGAVLDPLGLHLRLGSDGLDTFEPSISLEGRGCLEGVLLAVELEVELYAAVFGWFGDVGLSTPTFSRSIGSFSAEASYQVDDARWSCFEVGMLGEVE